jgi:hypothetical protein
MEGRQKQLIESYQRVKTFLGVHPAPAPASYAEPEQILEQVIAKLTDHSSEQVVGTRLGQAEKQKQLTLMRQLRERHLRPIVAIAKATMPTYPGIDRALRMPGSNFGPVRLLADAAAIRKAAELYQPVFVKNGRPADFLEQLSAAIAAVEASTDLHGTNVGRRVGAKAGISQELQAARRAVEVLDTIVKIAFEGNDVVLAEWRVAKRVRALPGGAAPAALASASAVAPSVTKQTAA